VGGDVGGVGVVPLGLVGGASVGGHPDRARAFTLYVLALLFGSALTIARPRFLLSALPAGLGLAAAGAVTLVEWGRGRSASPASAGAAIALLGLVLVGDARGIARAVGDTTAPGNPRSYLCSLEERAGAEWLRAHAADRAPAIVVEPLHGAWFLEDRPALRMPFTQAGVDTLRRRFGARWLVTTERDQAERLPSWA